MGRAKAANASPTRKSAKAAKDPNKPKRATTAYFYFMADFREQCKKDGSVDVKKVAEVTKAASEKWKNLTPSEKKPYDDKAAEDKRRYDKQMSSYVPPKGTSGKVGKKVVDPNKPKRPPSAYLLFLTDFRAQNSGKMSNTDIVKKGAEAWAALTKTDKEKYDGQASSAKSKYEQQVKNGGGGAKKAVPAAKPAAKPVAAPASDEDDDDEEMDDEEEEEDAEDDDDDDYNEDDD